MNNEDRLLADILRSYIRKAWTDDDTYLDCSEGPSICLDGWADVTDEQLAIVQRLELEAIAASDAENP